MEPAPTDLRQQAAQRLAAHRERRRSALLEAAPEPAAQRTRRNPIAAAVAERYAQTPSYRAVLAAEAQRAIDQAAHQARTAAAEAENAVAEAEIARRNAHAIAHTQHELLAELDRWTAPQHFTSATALLCEAPAPPPTLIARESLIVRLAEQLAPRFAAFDSSTNAVPGPSLSDADDALALDDEIAFRQAPVAIRLADPFTIEPPIPLAANLLEFPRQLVATRKARPRLAEGPLADDPSPSLHLRIFEVQPRHTAIPTAAFSVAPDWANIHLDAHVAAELECNAAPLTQQAVTPRPQTAPFRLRILATAVDLGAIGAAFLAFTAAAVHIAQQVPGGVPAAITAGVTLVSLYALYVGLFFTFSEQTLGMRYARISFCTLGDENPSRSAIRRRLFALGVALCPLGLGVFWSLLDEDGLGWQDRISRIYPRPY